MTTTTRTPTRHRAPRRLGAVPLAAMLTAGLGACGSADDNEPDCIDQMIAEAEASGEGMPSEEQLLHGLQNEGITRAEYCAMVEDGSHVDVWP